MDDELELIVAGLAMFGRPGLGPFVIIKDGLDGWNDGIALRGDKTARPQAHGSLSKKRYQESRTVTMTGKILAPSVADREMLMNELSGLLADGSEGRIQVKKGGITQWANASRDSLSIDPIHGTTNADFQLQLWCPDPRKFGRENGPFIATVGAGVNGVRHYGNYPAPPRFTVTGNMPGGYVLTIKGQVFTVVKPLLAGETHFIDYDNGRLRVNGAVFHGGVGYGFTPHVTPGVPTAISIAPRTTGTGTASLSLLDTYI
ncbi:hypothetical protein ARZXY2_2515 [Arthrobacter sp. ZXY-2]|nr:hypothetical protein ARZXY2_2515 [Arthrobacter sp. ZXY-2]